MGIVERSEDVRNAFQLHRLEQKLDHARSELESVDAKNQELRDQLDRERTMVRSVTSTFAKPRASKLRRVFVLAAAAGGAYVAGTAAGRERYRQIRARFDQMRSQGADAAKDVANTAKDVANTAKDVANTAKDVATKVTAIATDEAPRTR